MAQCYEGVWLSTPIPKEKELKRLTIDQLFRMAKSYHSVKHPLKRYLIACILKQEIFIGSRILEKPENVIIMLLSILISYTVARDFK